MNEADWKRKIVKQFKDAGHYARRIEDQYSVGFPDLVIGPSGMATVFVEVKIVRGQKLAPSPRQYIELMALHNPPYRFGVVLGVEERLGMETHFHFSLPRREVTLYNCWHSIDPVHGLQSFLLKLGRLEIV